MSSSSFLFRASALVTAGCALATIGLAIAGVFVGAAVFVAVGAAAAATEGLLLCRLEQAPCAAPQDSSRYRTVPGWRAGRGLQLNP